jgi:hypothetical protein
MAEATYTTNPSVLRERVARALYDQSNLSERPDFGREPTAVQEAFRKGAAAALALTLEAAAKIADDHTPAKHDGTLAAHCTGRAIAAAIRAALAAGDA